MAPIICIVGRSGSGKTTIIEKLIGELKSRGLRIGTIKHHIGDFDIDLPGKDSWRHKQAGSVASIISSPHRIGLVMDTDRDQTPEELSNHLPGVDLILAEGYKRGDKPKIEILRSDLKNEPFCKDDEHLIALVSDTDLDIDVPRFGTNDAYKLASYLVKRFNLNHVEASAS